jgi:hypothetical protein
MIAAALGALLLFNITSFTKLDCSGQEFRQTYTGFVRLSTYSEIGKCCPDAKGVVRFSDRLNIFRFHRSGNNCEKLIVRRGDGTEFSDIRLSKRSNEFPAPDFHKSLVSSASDKPLSIVRKMETPSYLNHSGLFIFIEHGGPQILSDPDYRNLFIPHFVQLGLDSEESESRYYSASYANEPENDREPGDRFGRPSHRSFVVRRPTCALDVAF